MRVNYATEHKTVDMAHNSAVNQTGQSRRNYAPTFSLHVKHLRIFFSVGYGCCWLCLLALSVFFHRHMQAVQREISVLLKLDTAVDADPIAKLECF